MVGHIEAAGELVPSRLTVEMMILSHDGMVRLIPSLMGTQKEVCVGQLHTEWHDCDFL